MRIEDFTPDDYAEAIAQEIKQTPIAIAKDMAISIEKELDAYSMAKALIERIDKAKDELAKLCTENNIYEIELGNHLFTIIRAVPESMEYREEFDVKKFAEEHPKMYKKYLANKPHFKSGKKAYLREKRKNG